MPGSIEEETYLAGRKPGRFVAKPDDTFSASEDAAKPEVLTPGSTPKEPDAIPSPTAFAAPGDWSTTEYAPPANPTLDDQVAYISGLNANGTLAPYSYWTWTDDSNPDTYSSTGAYAKKWSLNDSIAAGTSGGTIKYYFESASGWNDGEEAAIVASLNLWAAATNVSFEITNDSSATNKITFKRGTDGAAHTTFSGTGSGSLRRITNAVISIDTREEGFGPLSSTPTTPANFSDYGGYPWQVVLHEIGHALGLGHAGPYPLSDSSASENSLQYSAYDNHLYTIMSYISPSSSGATFYNQYNPTGTNWGTANTGEFLYNRQATTYMPVDLLAIQRLYGTPASTPFSGGQTYGFNTNIAASVRDFYDFTVNTRPIVTLWNAGGGNTLDASGFNQNATVNLNPGTFSSIAGLTNNIGIAYNTAIDRLYTGIGNDNITGNDNNNYIFAGGGTNTINGAGGDDTVAYAMARSVYTVTTNSDGSYTINGSSTNDTLRNIEFLAFLDQTIATSNFTNPIGGTPGNDTLNATIGNDSIDGLGGTDTVSYTTNSGGVTVSLAITTAQNTVGSGYDTIVNIENLTGTPYADTLTGDDKRNEINGYGGADIINGGGGDDVLVNWAGAGGQIDGGDGNDHLRLDYFINTPQNFTFTPGALNTFVDGTTFRNIENLSLISGNGDDTITFLGPFTVGNAPSFSAYGHNFWSAAGGYDTLKVDFSPYSDPLQFAYNSNTTFFYAQNNPNGLSTTILGATDVESFHITGGSGNDRFDGGPNGDVLQGGPGDDYLNGGGGLDMASYANAPAGVTLNLALGVAQNTGGGGTDHLVSIEGVIGSAFNDVLTGSASDNRFQGGTGTNQINGGGGYDTAVYTLNRSAFTVRKNGDGTIIVSGAGIYDTLTSIETLAFADVATNTDGIGNATGDFNDDGRSDILWQNIDGRTILWQMNGATILSSDMLALTADPAWKARVLGDFYGDGTADMIWQNDNGQVVLVAMNGATVTGVGIAGNNNFDSTWKVRTTGDFNGDGKSDILWQNDNGSAVMWLMNGAALLSSTSVGPSTDPTWRIRTTGDFNGDGKSDILWQNKSGEAVMWLMSGSTILSDTLLSITPDPTWQIRAAGDFYDDGTSDIIWQNDNGQAIIMSMNGTTIIGIGTIGNNTDPAWKIRSAGDYNGDGKSDILWQSDDGRAITWLMNGAAIESDTFIGVNGGPGWSVVSDAQITPPVRSDFNGDRKSDILFQNTDGRAVMWQMNGNIVTANSSIGANNDPAWKMRATGDFNGDGKGDILWQNDDGRAVMWQMNGTSIASDTYIGNNNDAAWKIRATGDFNGDGKSDILWQNDNGRAVMWLMNGTSIASDTYVGNNIDPAWKIRATGDFNGDGKSDILWQNDNGRVVIWLMNGTSIAADTYVGNNIDPAWKIRATGDFNGDGKSDILWQNDNGRAAMWTMDGAAIFSDDAIGNNTDPNWTIRSTGDYNGDGRSDILWQNINGPIVIWTMSGSSILSDTVVGNNNSPAWIAIGG